jgi:hypothetical protein
MIESTFITDKNIIKKVRRWKIYTNYLIVK